MVAVRMVSEGVDVPRLAVGVYATSSSTPLFFAQAIGRFVRARRRGETASVFLPNVPVLMALGARARAAARPRARPARGRRRRRPGLEDGLLESANREEKASDELEPSSPGRRSDPTPPSTGCSTTAPSSARSPSPAATRSSTSSASPGMLEPEQVAELLRHRQARQARRASERRARGRDGRGAEGGAGAAEPVALYRTLKEQRSLLNSLVGLYARHTGEAHSLVHAELRRACGGPEVAQATVTQLQARIECCCGAGLSGPLHLAAQLPAAVLDRDEGELGRPPEVLRLGGRVERRHQVGREVVDVLEADREPHDAAVRLRVRGDRAVRERRRVLHERVDARRARPRA